MATIGCVLFQPTVAVPLVQNQTLELALFGTTQETLMIRRLRKTSFRRRAETNRMRA